MKTWGHKELAFKSTARFKIPQGIFAMEFGIVVFVDLLVITLSSLEIDEAFGTKKALVSATFCDTVIELTVTLIHFLEGRRSFHSCSTLPIQERYQ